MLERIAYYFNNKLLSTNKLLSIQRKNICSARTVSIEAVMQLRFYYAAHYFSSDTEVLFAFLVSDK